MFPPVHIQPLRSKKEGFYLGSYDVVEYYAGPIFSNPEKYKLKFLPLRSGDLCQTVIFKNSETWFIQSKSVAKIYWTHNEETAEW